MTVNEEITPLQKFIDGILADKASLKLLEAGCGSVGHVHFDKAVYAVGIDISAKQLQRNEYVDERILGDIQDYDLPNSSFDVIVCWDVLEHLPKPEKALERFAGSLKETGIMILKMPNVYSIKGLVTKYLPYSLHIGFYRIILRKKNAGKEDTGPFRTYLRYSIAPEAIKRFAANCGLQVVYFDTFDILSRSWFRKNKVVSTLYKMGKEVFRVISFGKLNDSEFIIVLQKPPKGDDLLKAAG